MLARPPPVHCGTLATWNLVAFHTHAQKGLAVSTASNVSPGVFIQGRGHRHTQVADPSPLGQVVLTTPAESDRSKV